MGITHFMAENGTGFSGVLKQRFSDFIVHEVRRALLFQSGEANPAKTSPATAIACLARRGFGRDGPSFVTGDDVVADYPCPFFGRASFGGCPHPLLTTHDLQLSWHRCSLLPLPPLLLLLLCVNQGRSRG